MHKESIFKQIFHSCSNGVLATDVQGMILQINPQAERILKLSARQDTGRRISTLLPEMGPLLMHCLTTREPLLCRHVAIGQVHIVLDITLLQVADQIQGGICHFQEMKRFETVAKELEPYKMINRQLECMIDSSFDGIWLIDHRGIVLRINKAAENLNGLSSKQVVGKPVLDAEAAGLIEGVVSMDVLESQKKINILTTVKDRQVLVSGAPVFDENGRVIYVVANERDMTELNALREELANYRMEADKFKDELNQLNRLELKDNRIVAESRAMLRTVQTALKLAHLDISNILIVGESGTGKGLLANFIHQNSKRRDKPFIQINCAAIPENLLEAELFGYEQGAFTGAKEKGKAGLLELAHEGTLFLDEIGDMPLSIQAKVLKYLDDSEVLRLGGVKSRKIDCRVIAATNRHLASLVEEKKFRQDLFYRLNSFTMLIPPLHERPDDIPPLAMHFLDKFNTKFKLKRKITPWAVRRLQAHRFRGNVRELRNLLEKAVVMSEEDSLDSVLIQNLASADPLLVVVGNPKKNHLGLKEQLLAVEKSILESAVQEHRTTREMASQLGIDHSTVVRKLRRHGLTRSGA